MECEITHVDRFSSFTWTLSCFRVLTLEFVKVFFKKVADIEEGVLLKDLAPALTWGKYLCTSHCCIDIEGKKYTVLWKLSRKDATDHFLPPSSSSADFDSGSEDEDEAEDADEEENETPAAVRSHCLPFKVMGTCYSTDYQTALEEAFEYMYEHNRPVLAKLVVEPDNPYDQNAIAVYIMSSEEYQKVGYIARELTKFVHPLLKGPSTEVNVKRIRHDATYKMVGFYLTIEITKKGVWEKEVMIASRKVR